MRLLTGDCWVAALATVTSRSYEDAAALLGFELQTGKAGRTPWPHDLEVWAIAELIATSPDDAGQSSLPFGCPQ